MAAKRQHDHRYQRGEPGGFRTSKRLCDRPIETRNSQSKRELGGHRTSCFVSSRRQVCREKDACANHRTCQRGFPIPPSHEVPNRMPPKFNKNGPDSHALTNVSRVFGGRETFCTRLLSKKRRLQWVALPGSVLLL